MNAEGYATGEAKAHFEVIASLGPAPRRGLRLPALPGEACQVKRACLQKVMPLMAGSSPGIFELVEAWALEDNDDRS